MSQLQCTKSNKGSPHSHVQTLDGSGDESGTVCSCLEMPGVVRICLDLSGVVWNCLEVCLESQLLAYKLISYKLIISGFQGVPLQGVPL